MKKLVWIFIWNSLRFGIQTEDLSSDGKFPKTLNFFQKRYLSLSLTLLCYLLNFWNKSLNLRMEVVWIKTRRIGLRMFSEYFLFSNRCFFSFPTKTLLFDELSCRIVEFGLGSLKCSFKIIWNSNLRLDRLTKGQP